MAVRFNFLTKTILRDRSILKLVIKELFIKEKKILERLDYIFCDDAYLLDLNRSFLNHDYYTDIITFDMSLTDQIVGEIYISVDTVRLNSERFKTTFSSELHRVIFHGALHLCGYGDKSRMEVKQMRSLEDRYLKKYARRISSTNPSFSRKHMG